MKLSKNRSTEFLKRFIIWVLLLLTAFAVIGPIVVIVSSAFKTEEEIFSFPMSLIPNNPIIENFRSLNTDTVHFPLYIANSFKLTTIIVSIQVVTATMGGYAFAKLRWKGRDFVFLLFIASIMIPIQVYIIPQFIIVRSLGLYDTHLALILISVFTAFGTFMVKQFFMTIPDSLLESARIDGAHEIAIFSRIMLPLSKPVLATVIIFSFRFFWNDFFGPLIFLSSPEKKTLPLGLSDFATEYFTWYGPQMAASLIAIIPVMIVFIAAQKYIIRGVIASGLKG
ncbi:MAG: sugar ABC transporter ATP-binding protein [Spirochaetales bacterium]|nr:MAG: sugar ABC transporter ATP-binding protein [Spirochaetales bacterium]